MNARLGLCDVWLASGTSARAHEECDELLEVAGSTDCPNLQALALDARVRVAVAEKDWKSADEPLQRALELAREFEMPNVAWRVHATAAELHQRAGREAEASEHRRVGRALVARLADELAVDPSLRSSLQRAAAARLG